MSDTKDLKELLDRMRKETGAEPAAPAVPAPAPDARRRPFQAAAPAARAVGQRPQAVKPPERPSYNGFKRPDAPLHGPSAQSSWGESKEAILFGMFSSLLLALGGVLAGLEYLCIIGGAAFMFFSAVMAMALYAHLRAARPAQPQADPGLTARVDALSRKVELLAEKASAAPSAAQALEAKVEELRVMVRNLARLAGEGDKPR